MSRESESKKRLAQFAAEHPLPRTPEGMAAALLDIAALLVACKGGEAKRWESMSLGLQYRRKANPYPGAFLSNPALLAEASGQSSYGKSHASFAAGCFFSYPHYQESTLGPALLLPAFSPRQSAAARPLRLYAQALQWLVREGWAEAARASAGGLGLDQLAKGGAGRVDYASLSATFNAGAISRLDGLRTDAAMEAARLALSGDEDGAMGASLFTPSAKAGLERLIARREAERAAELIAQEIGPAAPGAARAPRM